MVGPWKEHTEHDFVRQIGDGTLPVDKFKMYLIQDYLYLVSGNPFFGCRRDWRPVLIGGKDTICPRARACVVSLQLGRLRGRC